MRLPCMKLWQRHIARWMDEVRTVDDGCGFSKFNQAGDKCGSSADLCILRRAGRPYHAAAGACGRVRYGGLRRGRDRAASGRRCTQPRWGWNSARHLPQVCRESRTRLRHQYGDAWLHGGHRAERIGGTARETLYGRLPCGMAPFSCRLRHKAGWCGAFFGPRHQRYRCDEGRSRTHYLTWSCGQRYTACRVQGGRLHRCLTDRFHGVLTLGGRSHHESDGKGDRTHADLSAYTQHPSAYHPRGGRCSHPSR